MTRKLTGWGLWAIAAAGVLTLVEWVAAFFSPDPNVNTDQAGYARAATEVAYSVAGYLYIIGLLALLFGVLAIYASLARSPVGTYAVVGMLLGVTATTLLIGVWTILVFATPIVGDVYLSGHPGAGEVFKVLSGAHWSGRMLPLFIVIGLCTVIAAFSLGDAIRRSRRFPRWVGLTFGLAFGLSIASQPLVSLAGALLLIVAGIALAREPVPIRETASA
jgi:hypothetical protein